MFQPSEHERTFPIKPIGVKYICEFCGEGEMKVSEDAHTFVLTSNPPLIKHVCTKCGKEMLLPKSYPYVEWVAEEEGEE